MTTLTQIYDQKIENAEMKPDADQHLAIAALQKLNDILKTYQPKVGWIDRLRGRNAGAAAPQGFYLYGGVGRGKSMVMDLFFANAPIAQKRRVHFHEFMLEVHDFLHQQRQIKTADIDGDLMACADKIARDAVLLCFDEFQVKDVADAMILGRLFTALLDRGVVVVMTSNIAPKDLYLDGLQRDRFVPFIELLQKRLHIVHFGGGIDYRLGQLRDLNVYFWPNDSDAAEQLEIIFKTATGGMTGEALDIKVKGRIIHVPKAAKEVCAFTFDELCAKPKSALDYLELTKRFKVFIVSDVPKMGDERKDAVLRFITLIDTLYDHHALVVISADVSPEVLYHGEQHAQVFDRTISRLMEMQSRKYKGDRQ